MAASSLDQPYSGRLVEGEHRFAVRVYYEDTDAGGVVYHAGYLRFFERARSDMLACAGIDHIAAHTNDGLAYVVAEIALRYLRPARLGDALLVVSRVESVRATGVVVHQRVMRDDDVIAEGRVSVVLVGPNGRPRRQPQPWIMAFEAVTAGAESPA